MSDQLYCLGYERSRLRKGPDRTQEEFEKSVADARQQCADLRATGQLNFHFAKSPNRVMQRFEVIPGVVLSNPRR
jgi:5,10-methylenetetrahydrofolate reductase